VKGFICALMAVLPALGDELPRVGHEDFERFERELEELSGVARDEATRAEIERAERWLADGRSYLGANRVKRAGRLGERLPSQLTLIRSRVAAEEIVDRTRTAKERLVEVEERVRRLRSRYDRLIVRLEGAEMTDAYPPLGAEGRP
jgi:hypothetical protein